MARGDEAAAEALVTAEPRLLPHVEAIGLPPKRRAIPVADRFGLLARAIVFQQLAGKAAATIHGRIAEACGGEVAAEALIALGHDGLRANGASTQKAAALLDLATHELNGSLPLATMARMDDEQILERLTAVRGIGVWTAEMFMMNGLGRRDVWPAGDLGVRQGWGIVTGARAPLTDKQVLRAADHCSPERSALAWYCWRIADASKGR